MEITFINCSPKTVPVFIAEFTQLCREYTIGDISKKQLFDYYAAHLVADNTKTTLNIEADWSASFSYIHDLKRWSGSFSPACLMVDFIDLTPKAPCSCCGK
jgi:hypothetical protein